MNEQFPEAGPRSIDDRIGIGSLSASRREPASSQLAEVPRERVTLDLDTVCLEFGKQVREPRALGLIEFVHTVSHGNSLPPGRLGLNASINQCPRSGAGHCRIEIQSRRTGIALDQTVAERYGVK